MCGSVVAREIQTEPKRELERSKESQRASQIEEESKPERARESQRELESKPESEPERASESVLSQNVKLRKKSRFGAVSQRIFLRCEPTPHFTPF